MEQFFRFAGPDKLVMFFHEFFVGCLFLFHLGLFIADVLVEIEQLSNLVLVLGDLGVGLDE